MKPPRTGPSLFRRIATLLSAYAATCAGLLGLWVSFKTDANEELPIPAVTSLVAFVYFLGFLIRTAKRLDVLRRAERMRIRAIDHANREREADRLEQESSRRIRDAAQRKREEIRARCEAAFHIHGPEIADRFPRSAFDQFCTRYLGDDKTPEVVEARARELLAIIQSYVNKIDPVKVKPSLESILSTFDERRQKVTRAGLETNDEKYLLTQLNELRDEAIRKAVMEGTL